MAFCRKARFHSTKTQCYEPPKCLAPWFTPPWFPGKSEWILGPCCDKPTVPSGRLHGQVGLPGGICWSNIFPVLILRWQRLFSCKYMQISHMTFTSSSSTVGFNPLWLTIITALSSTKHRKSWQSMFHIKWREPSLFRLRTIETLRSAKDEAPKRPTVSVWDYREAMKSPEQFSYPSRFVNSWSY